MLTYIAGAKVNVQVVKKRRKAYRYRLSVQWIKMDLFQKKIC